VAEVEGEDEGGGDPEGGAGDGGVVRVAGETMLAARVDELDGEEDEEGEMEANPFAESRGRMGERCGGHALMLSRVGMGTEESGRAAKVTTPRQAR
jgi:hypothetical protein